jgi:RNA polymerase sigma-70 factor, ECF subfamily
MTVSSKLSFSSPIHEKSAEHPLGNSDIYSDDLLLELARAGNMEAFESLIARHESSIFRTTLRITRHYEDAEDAVQEAALKAYRHIQQFNGSSKFSTWFTSIAINQALMCLRKRRRSLPYAEPSTNIDDAAIFLDFQDFRPNPEQQYRSAEVMGHLQNSVLTLSLRIRSAFVLQHFYEFTTEETAAALGITVSAVKSRVLRAHQHLRKRLKTPLKRYIVFERDRFAP